MSTFKYKEHTHRFHIPVMGTGFTIDTPLRVAKYGISSVISLLDDVLIEQMRKYHSEKEGLPYQEIKAFDRDSRARRITSYLNLINKIVTRQIQTIRRGRFERGTETTRYFELLPSGHLRREYRKMLLEKDAEQKEKLQKNLRGQITPGSIDVNIMTKCDRDNYKNGKPGSAIYADAMSALRGFAKSKIAASVIFSAGMNQRLYTYASEFKDFLLSDFGDFKKKIVLKVSDFRSAEIQGKFLAKRGLWVSEYRIESGLNCGGHAFGGKGHLLGLILEEFREKRKELINTLYQFYYQALNKKGMEPPHSLPLSEITVQGGIGTAEENDLLLNYYMVDGTGWGTPFMLVPEVVNLDNDHLRKLVKAHKRDILLSDTSPLDVPFWTLKKSASEKAKKNRIRHKVPGSLCTKGYPAFNSEFTTVPICTASRLYQKLKLDQLKTQTGLKRQQLKLSIKKTLQKSCLCHDLGGVVTLKTGIDRKATPAITTGPNVVNFSKATTLDRMVNYIYGRAPLFVRKNRKHMFIAELALNIEKLKRDIKKYKKEGLLPPGTCKQIQEYKENLLAGIKYYKKLAEQFVDKNRKKFLADLKKLSDKLESLSIAAPLRETTC